jgi:drug/metabolite transporter (DMT)-like permease
VPPRTISEVPVAPDADVGTATAGALAPAKAWLAFSACGAIWGSTFLVISIGNDALPPLWAATLRLILATGLLSLWTVARGDSFPRGPALRAAMSYGVCQFGINFPLLYWGEKSVPSGLSAVLYATIPLTSALFTRALGMERLTAAKIIGAVTAFAGVAVLFSGSLSVSSWSAERTPWGLLAVLTGTTAASLGTVLLKRGPRQGPIAANAVACAVGVLIAGALSFAASESHPLPATWSSALPLLYLTIAGSLGAFVLMSWLLHHWSVSRTSYVTVIVPVIALALGSIVRHERLGVVSVAGTALVLAGLLIGMRGGRS